MDFLADVSALKVIDPDEVAQAVPPEDRPVPKSDSSLLQKLKYEDLPYAHCAWCTETPKTSMLEEQIHHVMLQPSCCAPPSVFQTIMGKGTTIATQGSFGSYLTDRVFLREGMKHNEAKDILGASCAVQDDRSKVWFVKMPELIELEDASLLSPELQMLDEDESDPNQYLDDPTDPAMCEPEQDHDLERCI